MREKIYNVLNKIYGVLMTISFFAGAAPLVVFLIALVIRGPAAESMTVAMKDYVYPYIIAMASIAVLIGWIAMYVGKQEGLSVKSFSKKETDEEKPEEAEEK